MLGALWYKFLREVGGLPKERNMLTVEIFDSIEGKGLDIGHDGNYGFKNGDVVRLNIYEGDNIDVVCNGQDYPFDDNVFDKVLLRCLLEHVKNPEDILKEVNRILKPGGRIVIEVPFINPIHGAPEDYLRFTPLGLETIVKKLNFKIEDVFYVEDQNWAIRWILWQRLKEKQNLGLNLVLKLVVLKYLIFPILLRTGLPTKNNFSSFGMIIKKEI